jgi:acyl-CoA hydrolase
MTMNDLDGRPTSHSRVTLSRIMTAIDVNLYGTVHGGVLMKFVDDVAGAAAARHSGGTAVTAAIDEILFVEPVRVGDLVTVRRELNDGYGVCHDGQSAVDAAGRHP